MASVTVAGLGAVVSAAAVLGVLTGGAITARHRAGAAADFAALAAAARAYDPVAACRFAAEVAARDGAVLEACVVAGGVADVRVAVALHGALARFGPARARARAGPALG